MRQTCDAYGLVTRMAALVTLAGLASPAPALAHPLSFGVLALREDARGDVDLELDVSDGDGERATRTVDVTLPARCHPLGARTEARTAVAIARHARYRCGAAGLGGSTIALDGLDESLQIAVRIERPGHPPLAAVLDAAAPTLAVDAAPRGVFRGYCTLGVTHILGGADHLLFVLGLVLIARRLRALLVTVTAFTLGHSVSLALAAVGVVHVPPAPVEACIALSILFVATEAARSRARPSLTSRRPYVAAAAFGLLHGLGFAGALAQIGLPPTDVPLALFSFNVGVELGQLAFLAVALPVCRRLSPRWRAVVAHVVGALAVYWLFTRLAALG